MLKWFIEKKRNAQRKVTYCRCTSQQQGWVRRNCQRARGLRKGLSLAIWWSWWNLFSWSNTYEGHPYLKSISREARAVILAPAWIVYSGQSVFFPADYLYSNLNNFNWSFPHEYGINWKLFTSILLWQLCFFVWCFIMFICFELNYVLLILLRRTYWAAIRGLNGFSNSSHCLTNFC